MKYRSFTLAGFVVAAASLLPGAAAAAPDGFSLNRFDPAERGSRWFAVDSLEIQGQFRPAIGATFDYQYRPLAVFKADGSIKDVLVGHVITTDVGANMVLWDRVRVGVNLPVVLYDEGESTTVKGVRYNAPADAQQIGDVRLGVELRLFGKPNGPITMALGGRLYFPTGSPTSYTGDGAFRGGPRLGVAGKLGPFVYGVSAMAMFRSPKNGVFADVPIDHEVDINASAGLSLWKDRLTIGPEVYGSTVMGDDAFKTRTTPLEVILGTHVNVGAGIHAGIGAGTAIIAGLGSPVFRGLATIEWAPGGVTDTDGDGIPDSDDACPRAKGPASDDPHQNGCSVVVDNDGDGIPDDQDACPDSYGKKTNDPRTNGCDDSDKDGVFDSLDACPNSPGPADPDPKKNGCPVFHDRDGDTIEDAVDACPDKAGPADPDPKKNGCPDPDRDKDGIPNETDACPDVPGPANAKPQRNGCPIAFVHGSEIFIKEQVNFKIGSFELDGSKTTLEVLNGVKDILVGHPEIKKIRIEGHTDNRGNAAWNKKLSGARATAVVTWLTRHGVAKDRMSSAGYGQERPLDSNDSDVGRAANRRVEFHIVDPPPPPTASDVELPSTAPTPTK